MSWITLTEADVRTALSSGEFSAYTAKALAVGQANPLAEQIARVTKLVRGYVAACDRNVLGPVGTIPEELEGAAVDMVAYHLVSRLPVSGNLAERLQERFRNAESLLKDVAKCHVAVEQPPASEVSSEDIPGAQSPRITARTRRMTYANQDGI